jgi:formate dehydrogenase major subunit
VFGAGGGTSSYREVEDAEVILLWGSNARETHPIFFHHVLVALRRGARLYVVDPRATSSAAFAHRHLGIDVGGDIALANGMAAEILRAGLADLSFVERATTGFADFAAHVSAISLAETAAATGVPAALVAEAARDYASADRAMICWTLGITEHHSAVDNVRSLINLALLTGHVGRYGSGLNPLRGQNNVQGGGDMGAIPNKYPGFQEVEDETIRARFEAAWGVALPPRRGMHLSEMFDAMDEGRLRHLYVVGENPAASEADVARARRLLSSRSFLVVQDLFLTATAALADVVLPAAAGFAETEGTVTNSERRVQRVRRAVAPPGEARDDLVIVTELARRLGAAWPTPDAEAIWDEVRALSPMHAGMSYARLEAEGGLQWPCYDLSHPGETYLHSRLWADPVVGPKAPFAVVSAEAPIDALSEEFPIRLTTGRRLDSYNTGVQSGAYRSPLRRGEAIELCKADAARLGLSEGDLARVASRRGSVLATVHVTESLRPGLAFMTLHFPDEVDTNVLTLDTYDPKSGTAEFKATAVSVTRASPTPATALVAGGA